MNVFNYKENLNYYNCQLPIADIADRHKRTPNAIMLRLDQEGFADYNSLSTDFYKTQIDESPC